MLPRYVIVISLTILISIANTHPFLTPTVIGISRSFPIFSGALLVMLGYTYLKNRHQELSKAIAFYLFLKIIKVLFIHGLINHSNLDQPTKTLLWSYFGRNFYILIVLLEQLILIISAYLYLTQKRKYIVSVVVYSVLVQFIASHWLGLENILLANSIIGILFYVFYQLDKSKNKFHVINFKYEFLFFSYFLFFLQYLFEMIFFKIELSYDLSYSYIIIAIITYLTLISKAEHIENLFYNNTLALFFTISICLVLIYLDKNPTFKIMYTVLAISYATFGYIVHRIKFKLR